MLSLYISCAHGLEELLVEELAEHSFSDLKRTHGGVYLKAERNAMYQMMMHLRTASRIYLYLEQFEVHDRNSLLKAAQSVDWKKYVSPDADFVVRFQGTSKQLRHSGFSAQIIKDGYIDYWREYGARPNVSKDNPELTLYVTLSKSQADFYIDLSGRGMHERGYRTATGPAPIRENLAAAISMRVLNQVNLAELDVVFDPFCGSGTLLIESAMIATQCAPGIIRDSYGWNGWLAHDESAWQEVVVAAQNRFNDGLANCKTRFVGNDIDPRVLGYADQAIHALGLESLFEFNAGDANKDSTYENVSQCENGVLICNPPYGERLESPLAARQIFTGLGAQIAKLPEGWKAGILAPDDTTLKALKLTSHKKYSLKNGPIDIKLGLYLLAGQKQFSSRSNSDIANRLLKNWQTKKKWAGKEGVDAFRVYDADLPDYNAAIDFYADHWVIQEYQAPKSVPEGKAEGRWWDLVDTVLDVLPVDPEKIYLKQRKRQKGIAQYTSSTDEEAVRFVSHEYNAQFWVNLTQYLDTGLFLDHRVVRRDIQKRAEGKRVLNLFAYTGAASVHAALGGAQKVTTVDLSKTYLNWAKDNFRLNHVTIDKHDFIHADCNAWLEEAAESDETWDLIFLDPPTFSNSKRMEGHFDVQADYLNLLSLAKRCLSPEGIVIFSTNMRKFKFDESAVSELGFRIENKTDASIPFDFKKQRAIHYCWYLFNE
ncbi:MULTISPECIES: bifunctional 23S rRNA (guanine(2069)-N(7))-methyltransferase RlmK/23S rRNA (guanine(2445)-N(2))-methyltransferase RlmL [Gammaproteobacteria]|uniref:bifunctional 23S rRNA (guanine(2069)-N(7))-methyltransferase RlmK/23S rRNA (guanine(2445)-N(2))-methyltransferase RlmL n=1 Tax=Gammaproteobacteria TaxID=1236 RepID=UPI000DD052BD|nr:MULTISPECIES: bifunctional 23S rRNA (guanine(2069)-N(7))-methyltransferase RlmK/23S rRNA (guanine(2445)-N(2))-methyltransferase RlmL [Gammaproteobacteria]RTE87219.1 bifunctional 23S rRNA (guanine(2069)-N(7))-methyltransferase RlmK/23S rRNA (guanine(2445)-N(2))-methyltransferase RlmL [Aliidiomarina sp. B3213]TCZ92993.1 bifunctional 23S rRNA (guanine(2069)-N(7))-methyltransferase RlmK/23S rRNA (guanine(2445)-N(2))-methyltransferase RlmL [Lysobacter sp. N42]